MKGGATIFRPPLKNEAGFPYFFSEDKRFPLENKNFRIILRDRKNVCSALSPDGHLKKETLMPRKITPYITKNVASLDAQKTALDAARLMTGKYIGSVVVTGTGGKPLLFTERDLMMKVVGQGKDPAQFVLKDIVDPCPVTVGPEEKCSKCLDLMKEHRCRHLMVFNGDEFVGLVTLRAMVRLMLEEKEDLITYLERYITGSL